MTALVPDRDHKLTLQQAFDIAWRKAHEMTERCAVKRGVACVYRDGKGNACLIGWCIPDGLLREELMVLTIGETAMDLIRQQVFDESCDKFALTALQWCHDEAGDMAECRNNLREFAATHNLTIPEAAK